MTVEVTVRTVEPSPTAVVAASTTWAEFPNQWLPMLNKVWDVLRSAPTPARHGHNVMLYKDDVPNVEVGVQVGEDFQPAGEVVCSALPGGVIATATHAGPVAAIGDTHAAVRDWCATNGHRLAGPFWEIYGDPGPDGNFVVEVCWLLAE